MATSQPTAAYRELPQFPGYRIGDDGSVWSRRRSGTNRGGFLEEAWHRMKPRLDKRGRPRLKLAHKHCLVCRLVLEAFVGPCPPGLECCHGDGNPANNRLANLRWDTRVANMRDRNRHGRTARGEKSGNARLTAEIVAAIRQAYAGGGHTHKSLATRYGVHPHLIYLILKGKIWAHCPTTS